MLRITTAVRGFDARMRRVASMPFMFGMAMSITTTSGKCSSARRTLSRPSAASATTAMSVCFSSSARRPSRTTVWSSANKMRMGMAVDLLLGRHLGDRQLRGDRGSPPRLRCEVEAPAQAAHPLLHAEQAQPPHDTGVEARSVVLHADPHAVVPAAEIDLDLAGV